MAKFQFLPAETKFYEWFEKATGNLLEAADSAAGSCSIIMKMSKPRSPTSPNWSIAATSSSMRSCTC